MIVTPDTFRKHLGLIKQYFEIMHLGEWIHRRNNRLSLPASVCAITFDDGWIDNYEYAFPILRESSTPATLFVVTDMIGTHDILWPERLSRVAHVVHGNTDIDLNKITPQWLQKLLKHARSNKLDKEHVAKLIEQAKSHPDQDIDHAIGFVETLLCREMPPPPISLMNWDQVHEMADSGLVNIGSHTRHHIRLNNDTPIHIIEDEIINSKKILESTLGRRVEAFCYPNGDIVDHAYTLVRTHYDYAVSTKYGWNRSDNDVHMLHRIGIHEDATDDAASFLARISGWM